MDIVERIFCVILPSYVIHLQTKKEEKSHDPWFFGEKKNRERVKSDHQPSPERPAQFGGLISQMLPVKRRIPKQSLLVALKQNKVFSSELVTLRVHFRKFDPATPSSKTNLFSVIIPNKVLPRAVDRHLIKRRIYQIIEEELKNLKENQTNLIIKIKKNPLNLNFSELKKEIIKLFNQARLLK